MVAIMTSMTYELKTQLLLPLLCDKDVEAHLAVRTLQLQSQEPLRDTPQAPKISLSPKCTPRWRERDGT